MNNNQEKTEREQLLETLGFELKHIGINCENEAEADASASTFEKMFGFPKKSGISSIFAGSAIEAMKTPYLGEKGHIAIGTNDIESAMKFLESEGFGIDMETAKYKDDQLAAVYLTENVSGFAIHLLQK